jgi:protein-tyrosine phosphatase
MFNNWFKTKRIDLTVDVHSHLLPGLDDGVKSFDESIQILQHMQSLGYEKVITTPHIYPEIYPNTIESIRAQYEILKKKARSYGLSLEVEFAAEYFMEQGFLKSIKEGEPLLSFGSNYVLFETSFYNKPLIFEETIFELKSKGYQPVFAHPERYQYLKKDLSWLRSLHEQGVKLQVNLQSLAGAYGETPRRVAAKLLDESLVSFLGSDIHRISQMPMLKEALKKKVKENVWLNTELR